MLENIKSTYIMKILFSYLNDSRKLKLIKYNKNFQRKININLEIYKLFSDRYIIYEEKGKGKEYDSYSDLLIYEGEFLKC